MSTPGTLVVSFVAGLAVAVASAPVGVSGAVFLLPIQFSVLHVPSPAVTPTNLQLNIVATPGALTRYRRQASLRSPLTILLLAGTVPGMVIGAIVRIFLIPGPRLFRLVAAGLLLPLGIWLCLRNKPPPYHGPDHPHRPSTRAVGLLALGVGVVGGIYGVGGGSLLSPILVGLGLPVSTVAPAALTSTFVTSLVGAITYTALATTKPRPRHRTRLGGRAHRRCRRTHRRLPRCGTSTAPARTGSPRSARRPRHHYRHFLHRTSSYLSQERLPKVGPLGAS